MMDLILKNYARQPAVYKGFELLQSFVTLAETALFMLQCCAIYTENKMLETCSEVLPHTFFSESVSLGMLFGSIFHKRCLDSLTSGSGNFTEKTFFLHKYN